MLLFLSGGPGAGKAKYCSKLADKYPDFVCISPASQIREGGASAALDQINKGEICDTVRFDNYMCVIQ